MIKPAMTQEVSTVSAEGKKIFPADHGKIKEKKDRYLPPTKVVIRRLPPTMTPETFIEHMAPLPEHDYIYFVRADLNLGSYAFSRAYINFVQQDDIFIFKDKFDGYIFLDPKGNEYPAVVEFAPFQKTPKRRSKKRDTKSGTLESDPEYITFLESFEQLEEAAVPSTQECLEEIEAKERELKANNGVLKVSTPLVEYIKQRKAERQRIKDEKKEERKRRELERKKSKEEERRKRKEAKEKEIKEREKRERERKDGKKYSKDKEGSEKEDDKQPIVKVLKNPEHEKDKGKDMDTGDEAEETGDDAASQKETKDIVRNKSRLPREVVSKERDRVRFDKEKEKLRRRDEDRQKLRERDKRDRQYQEERHKDRRESCKDLKVHKDERVKQSYGKPHKYLDEHRIKRDEKQKQVSEKSHQTQGGDQAKHDSKPVDVEMEEGAVGGEPLRIVDYEAQGQVERGESGQVDIKASLVQTLDLNTLRQDEESNDEENIEYEVGGETEKLDGKGNIGHSVKEVGRKDMRAERRIKNKVGMSESRVLKPVTNKDRPSLEIYRPGMGRLSVQKKEKDKEVGSKASVECQESTSNSSSPSPTPSGSKVCQDNKNKEELKKEEKAEKFEKRDSYTRRESEEKKWKDDDRKWKDSRRREPWRDEIKIGRRDVEERRWKDGGRGWKRETEEKPYRREYNDKRDYRSKAREDRTKTEDFQKEKSPKDDIEVRSMTFKRSVSREK